jgi:hypothetical protein
MSIRITQRGLPAGEKQLRELKREIGSALPHDYFSFLQENNGGVPETNEFDIPVIGGGSGVNEFFSADEVLRQKRRLHDRVPPSAWPIAHAEGGNYICLACGPKIGVFFWDHELEEEEGEEPSWANMFLLAETFTEFLENLRKFDAGSVQLKPGQVKSAWMDPDFKPEF